jgi:hypothetical protein
LKGNQEARLAALRAHRLVNVLEVVDQNAFACDLAQIHKMLSSGLPVTQEDVVPVGATVRITTGPFTGMVSKVLSAARIATNSLRSSTSCAVGLRSIYKTGKWRWSGNNRDREGMRLAAVRKMIRRLPRRGCDPELVGVMAQQSQFWSLLTLCWTIQRSVTVRLPVDAIPVAMQFLRAARCLERRGLRSVIPAELGRSLRFLDIADLQNEVSW